MGYRLVLILLIFSTGSWGKDQKNLIKKFHDVEIATIKKNRLTPKNVGFHVVDLETGAEITSHNSNKLFVPASTTKVPTTFFALETLGENFRFETTLSYSGSIKDGILEGNLYLHGNGDPFLTAAQLLSFAQSLESLGIKKISGEFVYDDSYLTKIPVIDPLGELDKPYNPGISALSVEFNRFTIWRTGRSRRTSKSQFDSIPQVGTIALEKTKQSFPAGTEYQFEDEKNKEIWKLSLTQRYRRKDSLPVRQPGLYTAGILQFFCEQLGISLPDPTSGKTERSAKKIHEQKSKPLLELAEATLEYSNNVLAELLLLRAARELKGNVQDLATSAETLRQWVETKVKSKNWKETSLINGSGMTAQNFISPIAMTELMAKLSKERFGNRSYWSLLSISGWKGWMEDRLQDPEHAFKVWAKTGSLDYASALTGFLITKGKRKFAFTIFTTDFEKRIKLNKASPTTSRKLRHHARLWERQAKKTQDDLLKLWIKLF